MPDASVVNRYEDGYRVGAALIVIGNVIKVVAGVVAVALVIGVFVTSKQTGSALVTAAGLLAAAVSGILVWAAGVVVCAQGQVLRATLDTAVASSHFMTDHERARAMGLSHAAVSTQSTTPSHAGGKKFHGFDG
jgi:hypothetical protein